VIYEIKPGALSLWSVWSRPNIGIISFKRVFANLEALSIQVGKALSHPVKVSIKTSNCLQPWQGGMWLKPTC
jgi:hypothetical protein